LTRRLWKQSSSYCGQDTLGYSARPFKGARSHIRNTGPRFIQGFQRYDKVRWNGTEAFVFGRRSSGYFDLRKLDGLRVHAAAKAADLRLLESANAFLIERKVGKLGGGNSSPS
jgi:hypothetical protein